MNKDKMDRLLGIYGWDGKFFLLTRDHTVEITETGEDDYNKKGTLFFYANQVSYKPTEREGVDKFGRNYIDLLFLQVCIGVQCLCVFADPQRCFHSLTTRKDGDRYLVRVRWDDMDVEIEVEEAFHYFTNLLKENDD